LNQQLNELVKLAHPVTGKVEETPVDYLPLKSVKIHFIKNELQTTEDVALAIIVVPERIQARVGKDGVIQLFELIISGHKPGEIHAFGPAAILGPNAFQVIHVQDFWWDFLKTKSRNVEAPTCASCHHPLFQYLGAGMFAFAKVEWVVMVHGELELVVMGKLLQATTR